MVLLTPLTALHSTIAPGVRWNAISSLSFLIRALSFSASSASTPSVSLLALHIRDDGSPDGPGRTTAAPTVRADIACGACRRRRAESVGRGVGMMIYTLPPSCPRSDRRKRIAPQRGQDQGRGGLAGAEVVALATASPS
eukprot:CAMPEP_0114535600 /NCGR_PEP_ID=MMETSP0109-20121206/28515_1 /TAXON_ID=29199 /ORGANISM="Chlorarachnion reptans, Strain CCCM449" /LENGTH=138 /DNA_ID=CAMNT_0001719201 /DNA_START=642 /DNA_END=1059 /DNA_ORIENTATION=+